MYILENKIVADLILGSVSISKLPDMKRALIIISLLLSILTISCSTTNRLSFACNEPSVDIYINGEYIGRELVSYVIPEGNKSIEVVCTDNGQEVYRRTFYANGHKNNELIDITIQKDYRFAD